MFLLHILKFSSAQLLNGKIISWKSKAKHYVKEKYCNVGWDIWNVSFLLLQSFCHMTSLPSSLQWVVVMVMEKSFDCHAMKYASVTDKCKMVS